MNWLWLFLFLHYLPATPSYAVSSVSPNLLHPLIGGSVPCSCQELLTRTDECLAGKMHHGALSYLTRAVGEAHMNGRGRDPLTDQMSALRASVLNRAFEQRNGAARRMGFFNFHGYLLDNELECYEGEFEHLLTDWATRYPSDFIFVQVGANDGVLDDPISRYVKLYGWKGILVEPLPDLFAKLRDHYKEQPGLIFERVAVSSERADRMKLFRVDKDIPNSPSWVHGLASFSREVILRHSAEVTNLVQYIREEEVPTTTLDALIANHKLSRIDLLQIDTEGYDFEVLKTLDLAKIKPKMIVFEHKHLNASHRHIAPRILEDYGYLILTHNGDTMAYLVD